MSRVEARHRQQETARAALARRAGFTGILVLGVAFAGALSFAGAAYIDSVVPDVVTGKVIADLPGEPISRWYLEVDSTFGTDKIEVGPALYECFEVGDTYKTGSEGRCEGVVWP